MTDQPPKRREWIGDMLEKVPVVHWDRFVVGTKDGEQYVSVYGWIDREDEYKDFVLVKFWPNSKEFEFTTSSDTFSDYLHAEWFGEDDLEEHNECRRVENAFEIDNAIELHETASLTEFAGGGE